MSRKARTLEIDEDLAFQQREWFVQRIGTGMLFLFVGAAMLGLTGMGGPLSHADVSDADGALRVEYERFVRRNAPATIKVRLRGGPGDLRFWVSSSYLEHVRIDTIVPPPQLVLIESDRQVFMIRSATPDVLVTLELEHLGMGTREAEVGLVDGPSVRLSQLAIF
jgi:hypothetical protein